MPSLALVLPAFNEEANVATAIQRASNIMPSLVPEYQIILVNDGSRDRTGVIAKRMAEQVPHLLVVEHYPNRGYGGALKAGFAAAAQDLIAFFPADNQFDIGELGLLLAKLNKADIVTGYRINDKDSLIRKFNRLGWNLFVRLLFGYLARDIDCGFKLFKREILRHVTLLSDGAMLDTELLAGAKARGYAIAEVPVNHLPRLAGSPTGANLRVIVRAFRDCFRFRLRLSRELRAEKRAAALQAQGQR